MIDVINYWFYNLVVGINYLEGVFLINSNIPEIYDLLQELSWRFGNHGFNGECCGDLSLVEFIALRKVFSNNRSPIQEIGSALSFTKSGATRIIDRLEGKGYVNREQSPNDGRICCAVINLKGIETINEIIEKYTAYLDDVLKDLDAQKIEQIKESLGLLVKAVQQKETP